MDCILRDVDRVRGQWVRAQRGERVFQTQAGHPLGLLDISYTGEPALSVVLATPQSPCPQRRETQSSAGTSHASIPAVVEGAATPSAGPS